MRKVLAVVGIALAALVGFVAVPAPAFAAGFVTPDPPCEWEPNKRGTESTCDGKPPFGDPWGSGLGICGEPIQPYQADIRGPGGVLLATVYLHYNRGLKTTGHPQGECRVAYARIRIHNPYAACYGRIMRNSDQEAYYTQTFSRSAYSELLTPAIYDAGVSSYAWGRCTYNQDPTTIYYDNGTPSY
jgi:hypothetical protein